MAQEGLVIAPGAIFEGVVEYERPSDDEAARHGLPVEALAG
jgi:hypothetical protein